MKTFKFSLLMLLLPGLLLTGCGGGGGDGAAAPDSNMVKVTINSDDQMKFDTELIEVPAGATVELTLNHVGELPVDVMGHNVVLLKQGIDLHEFALAAARAKETEYIPVNRKEEVIVHTRMLGGGESDTITFEAPAPGSYKFICSFPAHYMKMQGDFVVR